MVNEQDEPIGSMEKLEVHQRGLLHRAFSIFIFNSNGELLLQQRAATKYHSPMLWTNSCCSHPQVSEDLISAAQTRLDMELGFVTPLKKAFSFIYRTEFDNGLIEHEYDHVLVGNYDGKVMANPDEVNDIVYWSMDKIKEEIQQHPHQFTSWFLIAFPKLENYLATK